MTEHRFSLVEIQSSWRKNVWGQAVFTALGGTGSGLIIVTRDWRREEGKSIVREDRSVHMELPRNKGQKDGASGDKSGHSLSSCDVTS